MVIVAGHIKTDPARSGELLEDLQAGVNRSKAEDGCLFYSFAMESPEAGTILTFQLWRDEKALAAHLATEEIKAFIDKWTGHYEVNTKFYDAENERPVGQWNDPDLRK